MDLFRPFDTICHTELLEQLQRYEIRGNTKFLKSYLSNREQIVDINGIVSTLQTVTYGVV